MSSSPCRSCSKITRLSSEFVAAIKAHKIPQYKLAVMAGSNPTTFSKAIAGKIPVRPNSPEFQRIAVQIGFKGQIYTRRVDNDKFSNS